MNAKFETIMGRTREQLAGMTWLDVVHPEDGSTAWARVLARSSARERTSFGMCSVFFVRMGR